MTAKNRTRTIAIQNDGADAPKSETTVPILSKTEYCLTAETIPHVTPIITPSNVLSSASFSVFGYRVIISRKTGCPVL